MEIKKSKEMADIEIKKFKQIVGAIGQETIVEISRVFIIKNLFLNI